MFLPQIVQWFWERLSHTVSKKLLQCFQSPSFQRQEKIFPLARIGERPSVNNKNINVTISFKEYISNHWYCVMTATATQCEDNKNKCNYKHFIERDTIYIAFVCKVWLVSILHYSRSKKQTNSLYGFIVLKYDFI